MEIKQIQKAEKFIFRQICGPRNTEEGRKRNNEKGYKNQQEIINTINDTFFKCVDGSRFTKLVFNFMNHKQN